MNESKYTLPQIGEVFPAYDRLECGSCTACCTTMGVEELGKPQGCQCEHANNGCTIYENRPHSCRVWACGWKLGFLGEHVQMRPDNLGVMLNMGPGPDGTGIWLEFHATKPDAILNKPWITYLTDTVKRASKNGNALDGVVLFPHGSKPAMQYDSDTTKYPQQRGANKFIGNKDVQIWMERV